MSANQETLIEALKSNNTKFAAQLMDQDIGLNKEHLNLLFDARDEQGKGVLDYCSSELRNSLEQIKPIPEKSLFSSLIKSVKNLVSKDQEIQPPTPQNIVTLSEKPITLLAPKPKLNITNDIAAKAKQFGSILVQSGTQSVNITPNHKEKSSLGKS